MSYPIRITHLITGLCSGGAENMLMRLLSATDRSRFDADVVSMMDIGVTGGRIREMGFRVRALGIERRFPNPLAALKLAAWLRRDPPQVLATWMYHANFLGSIAARLAGGIPVVWGVHHGHIDNFERTRTKLIARACGWMSRRMVSKIICCSEHTLQEHALLGYDRERMIVIRNGFDLSAFQPDRSRREQVRRQLQIADDAPVVLLAGRYHPQKDYPNFVDAAVFLNRLVPSARFILCGHHVTWENGELAQRISDAGLWDCFRLLGSRDDVPDLLNASDIFCSSSVGEGFSLAIGEAMSCAVPCAVTDVGDSAFQVRDTGRVAPPSNPEALANACASLLTLPAHKRLALGLKARRRILDNFELSHIAGRYQKLYEAVASEARSHKDRVAASRESLRSRPEVTP